MFENAKLKVKRANQHIDDLSKEISAFSKSDFYSLAIKHDDETGKSRVQLSFTKSLPWNFPLIIGDAIHNLRAALDLMMTEVASDKSVDFVFRPTRQDFMNTLIKMKKLPSGVKDILINDIQPYEGGNGDALWVLNKMDSQDKHHLLLPTLSVGEITGVCMENKRAKVVIQDNTFIFADNGKAFTPIAFAGKGLEITNNGTPTLHVVFGQGQLLEGQPIVPALKQLSELVNEVIEKLEAHLHQKP